MTSPGNPYVVSAA